jgi:hypothetical protein
LGKGTNKPSGAPLPPPLGLTVDHEPVSEVGPNQARVGVQLVRGIYGEDRARVWLHWGRQDGGADAAAWEDTLDLGLNTRFGPVSFTTQLTGLHPATSYSGRSTV